jgi:hypothetical protein
MNFTNVPQWAWILLGVGAVFFAIRNGWLENLLKKPVSDTARDAPGTTPARSLSLLDSLQGYKTKLAALVVAVLAANELWHFVPDQYVSAIAYLAGALGLYGLRYAFERLKQKVDQIPSRT